MKKHELSAWDDFFRTGRVDAYLAYRTDMRNKLNFEAGDEFEPGQNGRDSDKRNKIR